MQSGLASRVTPRTAVIAIALFTFAVWAALGYAASVPRFFQDELYYMKAGVSVAQGRGLQFEGQGWGYGPVFPVLIAGIVKLTPSQESAYVLIKLANAAFFALALAPIYLVARRLLPPWPSVGVVALSAIVPSSMYVSVSMTESVGYFVAWWSILAILRVLEQPTVGRQVVALTLLTVAIATRPQFVALLAGYLVGLGLRIALSPALRAARSVLWPTALAVIAGLAWVARPVVEGHGVGPSLGSYSSLAQSYDPLQVAKWFVYHVGELALYVGIVPVIVAPVVLVLWWRRARAGSEIDAAVLSLFVALNVVGVGLIAAFASTSAGLGILYDRYLFYLVPLWLLVLVAWLCAGMPRPIRPLAIGTAAVFVVVGTLPFEVVSRQSWFQHFEAVATATWGKVGLAVAHLPLLSVRGVALLLVAAVSIAVVAMPRRHAWFLPGIVAAALVANLALGWRSAFVDAAIYGLDGAGRRSFVDARVGTGADVTVFIAHASCVEADQARRAALETDYFNRSVLRVVAANQGEGRSVPSSVTVRPDGSLFTRSGHAIAAEYVVAPPGVVVRGRRLATGMSVGLGLWYVGGGRVRLANAHSEHDLYAIVCRG